MRRRLSWAALGASGLLAVIAGAMIASGGGGAEPGPKIIVPIASGDAGLDLSDDAETQPSTTFIATVPPVAVTSTAKPKPPPPAPTTTARPAPKPTSTKSTTKAPERQVRRSFWDIYAAYLKHYRSTGNRYQDSGHYRDGRGGR